MKWKWIEKRWTALGRGDWIKNARTAFNKLVTEYQFQEVLDNHNYEPVNMSQPSMQRRRPHGLASEYFSRSDSESEDDVDTGIASLDEQLSEYYRDKSAHELEIEDSPIPYWIHHKERWPLLAKMALDIFATPTMSDEPERVFSTAGAAISSRRRSMSDETIEYLMCLKSWITRSVIKISK